MALVAMELWSLPGSPGASAAPRLWDLSRAPVGPRSPGTPGWLLKSWASETTLSSRAPAGLGLWDLPLQPQCLLPCPTPGSGSGFFPPFLPLSVSLQDPDVSQVLSTFLLPARDHPHLPAPSPAAALTLPGRSSCVSLGQETLNPSFAFPPDSLVHSPADKPRRNKDLRGVCAVVHIEPKQNRFL